MHPPPPHTHTTYFIWFFLWRFLAGHRVNQTSQGRMGGGIRLLCDIGHRDQRSPKPLQVVIRKPCLKTHTAHPHCTAARTKTGSSVLFSFAWPFEVGSQRENNREGIGGGRECRSRQGEIENPPPLSSCFCAFL